MRKFFITVIIVLVLSLIVGFFLNHECIKCVEPSGYFIKWNHAYYQPKGSFKGDEIKIKEADIKTFEIIDKIYAKDKNYVYVSGKKIEGLDRSTFTFLDDLFLKDKDHVYFLGNKIENADLKTFQILAKNYAKDKNNVYTGVGNVAEIIKGADSDTFGLIDIQNATPDYSRDKNYAYYRNKKIDESHGPTFELLEDDYSRDKNHVYHLDYLPDAAYKYQISIVENADPESFSP